MKKALALILSVALMLSAFGIFASAEESEGEEELQMVYLSTETAFTTNDDFTVTVYINPATSAEVNIAGLAFDLQFANYSRKNPDSDLEEYFTIDTDATTYGTVFTDAGLNITTDGVITTVVKYGWESISSVDINEKTELCTLKLKKNAVATDGRYDFDLILTEAYSDIDHDLENIEMLENGIYKFEFSVGEKLGFLNQSEDIPITLGETPVQTKVYLNAPVTYVTIDNPDIVIGDTGYDETLEMYYINLSASKVCNGILEVTSSAENGLRKTETLLCTINAVMPQVWFLSVVNMPDKTTYNAGDKIDTAGLKIKAEYNNGEKVELTTGFTLSEERLYTAGEHTVNIYYGDYKSNGCKFTVTINPFVKGDVNNDGSCNVLDLMQLKLIIAGEKEQTEAVKAAVHGSGEALTAADLITVKKQILGIAE